MPAPSRPRTRVAVALAVMALALVANGLAGCGYLDKKVDVLLIGDSIMNQSGSYVQGLMQRDASLGDVKVKVEAANGSGLMTPGIYDWMTKANELADVYQPKVVAILFVGNYTDTDLWVTEAGATIPNDYQQPFFDEWGRQAEKLTRIFQARGTQVDWVLPPPFLGDEGHRREELMRATYSALAARMPGVKLIDARQALGGPTGGFEWKLPFNGQLVTIRQPDSLHLTEAGGQLLAQRMALDIAPGLVAQRRAQAS
jgi:hypothetical protein